MHDAVPAERGRYEFAYGPGTPYANAVALVSRWRAQGGQVLVDLGCGYGAIADPVREMGLTYLGVDADRAAVDAIAARGHQAVVANVGEPASLAVTLQAALDGRPVAAVTMLDSAEHLPDAPAVLAALAELAASWGDVPLVVSIPNVSHRDLAAKLLLGRWDVTPTGLLDATHVRFFAPGTLAATMAEAGWVELQADDFELAVSDQHFPDGCVALLPGTPLGGLLGGVRRHAAAGATVNQFVRAYRPVARASAGRPTEGPGHDTGVDQDSGTEAPFLSVVVRTDGTRPATFDDLLLALAAQTCHDFEVVVSVVGEDTTASAVASALQPYETAFRDRVHVVTGSGPGHDGPAATALAADRGVAAARGRYVVVLDDDQVPFGHWVEMLRDAAAQRAGAVVRVAVATQQVVATPGRWQRTGEDGRSRRAGRADGPVPVDAYDVAGRPTVQPVPCADLLDLLAAPPDPVCGFAIPRSAFADLGVRFDPALGRDADQVALLHSVQWCGLHPLGEVGLLQRVWTAPTGGTGNGIHDHRHTSRDGGARDGEGMHDEDRASASERRARVLAALDAEPLLLDRASASRIVELQASAGHAPDTGAAPGTGGAAADHQAHVRALEAACADAEARLAAIHASSSWRVTAPLRAAVGWWRRR